MNEKGKTKLETLKTQLAIKQTELSYQRSLLSYIRTSCVFVSLAFTYLKIAAFDQFDAFVITMFIIGGFFLVFGIIEYIVNIKKNKKIVRHLREEFIKESELMEEDL